MPPLLLSQYLTAPARGSLAETAYGTIDTYDLADFLTRWPEVHRQALTALGPRGRIHPTAFVHPQAIIGDDVIIGPHARVFEFSTVRKGSVVCAGASIGFNCEVTAAFIGEDAVLGHRIGINRTLVGARAHLSASVTVAGITMSRDMRTPDREVILRTRLGIYRTGTPQFGAVIGDGTQTGTNISLGPGVAIGRHSQINTGVTLALRAIPEHSIVTAPHTAEAHVHSRRSRRSSEAPR
ncbi:transferase [Streptomyces sp. NPDC127084]|uniref:transferase n=1 Tax=Streptomyces sp. NPDC127084 TaxID=3347133 RepID=UPI00365D05FF